MTTIKHDPQEEFELWSQMATHLMNLRMAIEHADSFMINFSRYLEPKDRVEMAKLGDSYDKLYWKYFQKFIKKVRGL